MARYRYAAGTLYERIAALKLKPFHVAKALGVAPSTLSRWNAGVMEVTPALYARVEQYLSKQEHKVAKK